MKFKIYRYNPETDSKPYVQEYELEKVEPGMMLPDGIHPTAEAQPVILEAVWEKLGPMLY